MPDAPDRRSQRAILAVAIAAIAIAALSLLVVLPLGGDDGVDREIVGGHPLYGEPAPEIDLLTLDGERVTLSSLRGRPVLVNFWAPWCYPCREEFPLMVEAYERHAGDDLEILGVVHDGAAEGARAFAADEGATWPLLMDADDVAWNDYRGLLMPTSFFIDGEGIVRAFSLGGFTADGLAAQLAQILPDEQA